MEEKEYIKQELGVDDEKAELVIKWLGECYEAGYQQVTYKVNDEN